MIDFVTKPISNSMIVVEVRGRLTEMERDYFFDCVSDLIDSGYQRVIIECHKLGYLNTNGLASLLSARKKAVRKGGRIYLTHLNSNLTEILEVIKLGRLMSVFPSTKEVISSVGENELSYAG